MQVIRDARPPASAMTRFAAPTFARTSLSATSFADAPFPAPDDICAAPDVRSGGAVSPAPFVEATVVLTGEVYALPAALDLIDDPAALVDARGVTVCVNQAFRQARDVCRPIVAGLVALRRDGETKGATGSGVGLRYDPQTGGVVRWFRLRDAAGGDRGLLIILRAPSAAARCCEPAQLEQAFGLTPAEARLACALVKTKSLAAAIKELGLKDKTGRTYLDRIFQKTGARSQLQLYAILVELYLLSCEGL